MGFDYDRMIGQSDSGGYSMRVEMTDVDGTYKRADYEDFRIGNENSK